VPVASEIRPVRTITLTRRHGTLLIYSAKEAETGAADTAARLLVSLSVFPADSTAGWSADQDSFGVGGGCIGAGGGGELEWKGRLQRVLSDVVGYLSEAEGAGQARRRGDLTGTQGGSLGFEGGDGDRGWQDEQLDGGDAFGMQRRESDASLSWVCTTEHEGKGKGLESTPSGQVPAGRGQTWLGEEVNGGDGAQGWAGPRQTHPPECKPRARVRALPTCYWARKVCARLLDIAAARFLDRLLLAVVMRVNLVSSG
jgi:hypothetical protein